MKILGIETSCDETAVCLIEASGSGAMGTIASRYNGAHCTDEAPFRFRILGNALHSQIATHAPYGGVFPNLAKREHAKNLVPLLQSTLQQSHAPEGGLTSYDIAKIREILEREPELFEQLSTFFASYAKPDIDAIAVTYGPGLAPALWVGVNFARALSTAWNVPLVGVNHMEGHIVMAMMEDDTFGELAFPLLSLLISGWHTELVLSREWTQYEIIGKTRDDAVGEAFDKVARMLGLPYPGGPHISRLAEIDRITHAQSRISFTVPMLHSGDFDFSFSGLKTEVKKYVEAHPPQSDDDKQSIARAFEDTATKALTVKTMRATEKYGVQTIVVGGGVSANKHIRTILNLEASPLGLSVMFPPPELATDNAVMIALAGYFHAIKNDYKDSITLRADPRLSL